MTLRIADKVAHLTGVCGLADAEALYGAHGAGRIDSVDLAGCEEMHAAVAQILLSCELVMTGQAVDPFLRVYLAPALLRAAQR